MNPIFQQIALRPAEILMPAPGTDLTKWACVACDQYTSQPEYWESVAAEVGSAPSTLRLMLPECWLGESEKRIPAIHRAMAEALEKKALVPAVREGFVLCARRTAAGERLGLVATVDLEDYDFAKGSLPLVRPTEQTIAARLPARLAIRRGAPVELSHILILIDDPERTVLEPLKKKRESLRKLYDFELMRGGGHLAGWAVEAEEDLSRVAEAMDGLRRRLGEHPMLLAVGDGNHSLATAKAYWNEIRENLSPRERETHPARFALCEIENIHDEALLFEPIHRLITGTDPAELRAAWEAYAAARGMGLEKEGEGHAFRVVTAAGETPVVVARPEGAIPCETIQRFLDDYLAGHPAAAIDYIHGEEALRKLAAREGSVGFLLPEIDKGSFFADVKKLGVLPRKTFSMGEADEKRFYLEAKRIALPEEG